jgi:hypothetical protein
VIGPVGMSLPVDAGTSAPGEQAAFGVSVACEERSLVLISVHISGTRSVSSFVPPQDAAEKSATVPLQLPDIPPHVQAAQSRVSLVPV